MFRVAGSKDSSEMGCKVGSTCTSWHTSVSKEAVKSRISLCLMVGNPNKKHVQWKISSHKGNDWEVEQDPSPEMNNGIMKCSLVKSKPMLLHRKYCKPVGRHHIRQMITEQDQLFPNHQTLEGGQVSSSVSLLGVIGLSQQE